MLLPELKGLEQKHNKTVIPNEDQVGSYYKIRQQLDHLAQELQSFIHKPQYILPYLQPGRLVRVNNQGTDFGWGIVINFQKKASAVCQSPLYSLAPTN